MKTLKNNRKLLILAGRGVGIVFVVGLILGWMFISALPVSVQAQGEGTNDLDLLNAQATVYANRTRSFVQTQSAIANGTATAVRRMTQEAIADSNAKTKAATEKQQADAELTRQAIAAEQTYAAQTRSADETRVAKTSAAQTVVAQVTAQAMASQTAVFKTQVAETASASQTAHWGRVTQTAVAQEQEQKETDAKMRNLGMVAGYMGIALFSVLILIVVGSHAIRQARHPAPAPNAMPSPVERIEQPAVPEVVYMEPPIIEVVRGPEAEAEGELIAREIALQEEQLRQGKGTGQGFIDVTPKPIR